MDHNSLPVCNRNVPHGVLFKLFSYYQVPVSEEFGCTYAQFSLSNTASTVASILFSLTLASKLGKGNTRLFMLIGGLVGAVALYAQSRITAIWRFTLRSLSSTLRSRQLHISL